jgi:hypothetical protein
MIPIDWDKVAYLLEAGCSGTQIADMIGIHENTLYGRCKDDKGVDFVAFKAKNKAKGDSNISVAQYEAAVKDGDKTMLIWLGKQRLDQSEKQKTDLNHSGGITMIWEDAESGDTYKKDESLNAE